MPLAAPVTMATLSLRRMSRNSRGGRSQRRLALGGGRLQVVERSAHRVEIGGLMLVPHGGGGDPDRPIVERADHLIDLDVERRIGELFRKAPKLAAARDRR